MVTIDKKMLKDEAPRSKLRGIKAEFRLSHSNVEMI